jgi:DNA-binding winged helix-turn-helix (wHTH) protein/Tfp pilus assembly protein PilF
MSEQINRFYEFGPFRLVPLERQLMRDGKSLPLSPKAFDTLVMLVQRNGHAVKKDDLIEMLWPDAVVEENNLNQYVSALRKVLKEAEPGQQYIETVPRYGYRFTADVRETSDETNAVLMYRHSRSQVAVREEQIEEAVTSSFVDSNGRGKQMRHLTVAAGAIVVVAVLTIVFTAGHLLTSSSSARAVPKAVLHPETSPARQEYLAGRAAWNQRTSAGLFESIEHFERAIEKDPQFALAYNGLADAYAFDIRDWKKAESMANKALEIDPRLGEPHATIGFIRTFWEWNRDAAEREFEQAIKLNPQYATAHQWYAIHLVVTGRPIEAEVEMSKAVELEPASAVMLADMGQIFYFNEKYDEAIGACRKAISIDPGFFNAHQYLFEIYMAKGLANEALQELLILERTAGTSRIHLDADEMIKTTRSKGLRGIWKAMLIYRVSDDYEMARYYARLGENNKAIKRLQQALEKRDFRIPFVNADPVFDKIRSQPEFEQIIKRIGLA